MVRIRLGDISVVFYRTSCTKERETYRKIVKLMLVGAPNGVVEIVLFAEDTRRLIAIVEQVGVGVNAFAG